MTEFDRDNSNELTFEEFYELAKFQLGLNKRRWHKSIWFRIATKWTLKGEKQQICRGAQIVVFPISTNLKAILNWLRVSSCVWQQRSKHDLPDSTLQIFLQIHYGFICVYLGATQTAEGIRQYLRALLIAAVVWPAAGTGAKKGLGAIGVPAGRVPTAVAAFILEAAISSIASLR